MSESLDDVGRRHDKDVYELRSLIANLGHDVNAAYDAIRMMRAQQEQIFAKCDKLRWYEDNLDCVKQIVEQSLWLKQTRLVVVWLASGVAGLVLLWDTLFPFLRHK